MKIIRLVGSVLMVSSLSTGISACVAEGVSQEDGSERAAQTLTAKHNLLVTRTIRYEGRDWVTRTYNQTGEKIFEGTLHVGDITTFSHSVYRNGVADPIESEVFDRKTPTFEEFHTIGTSAGDALPKKGTSQENTVAPPDYFDNYGCDVDLTVDDVYITGPSCQESGIPFYNEGFHGACCDRHDACYAQNGCSAVSWSDTVGANFSSTYDTTCNRCNTAAAKCFAGPPTGQSACCSQPSTSSTACGHPRTQFPLVNSGHGAQACFVAGTMVTMADGNSKAIERITVGEEVLSFDTDRQQVVASKVIKTFKHDQTDEQLVVVNAGLVATANHPFYANGKWVRADALTPGDTLRKLDGAGHAIPATVNAVEGREPPTGSVYNLEVDGTHDYFAAGILVHNKALAPTDLNAQGGQPVSVGVSGGGYFNGFGNYSSPGTTGHIVVGNPIVTGPPI